MNTNIFGLPKYEISEILGEEQVVNALHEMFEEWLKFLEIGNEDRKSIINRTFESIRKNCSNIEEGLRQEYQDKGIIENIKEKLRHRANHIYNIIHPFIGDNVLDYGCGDGSIAKYIIERKKPRVLTIDIMDSEQRKKNLPDIPFFIKKAGEKTPFKNDQFDTSLLVTVLHHADNPLFELEEAARVTAGNIVIVESVYEIYMTDSPKSEVFRHPELYNRFHSLSCEQQRMYGTFLDWFLNKLIIGDNANCPYNFNSPENWERIFRQKGFAIEHKQMLGIDQMVTPEYHILYVVSKRKNND